MLTIHVLAPTEFEQSIVVTPPNKTSYTLYETLDFGGLTVTLRTKRTTEKEGPDVERNLNEDEYQLTIGGKTLTKPFILNEIGNYSFLITNHGFEATFTKDFTISVAKPSPSTPLTYPFDCLHYNEDNSKMTISFNNANKTVAGADKGYYSPEEVTLTTYAAGIESRHLTPSKGKVPLLAVPVVLSGDEANATDANWNLIQRSFFDDDDNLYYESLRSYDYKSSFGQLLFEGVTADYFYPGKESGLALASSYQTGPSGEVVRSIAKAIPTSLSETVNGITTTIPCFNNQKRCSFSFTITAQA